jgi:hypothetical protein
MSNKYVQEGEPAMSIENPSGYSFGYARISTLQTKRGPREGRSDCSRISERLRRQGPRSSASFTSANANLSAIITQTRRDPEPAVSAPGYSAGSPQALIARHRHDLGGNPATTLVSA